MTAFDVGAGMVRQIAEGIIASTPEAQIAAAEAAKQITAEAARAMREAVQAEQEATQLAQRIGEAFIAELENQHEAAMDAAEALVKAAADRMSGFWSGISDRNSMEDAVEAVSDQERDLAEAQAKLADARDLAGAGGRSMRSSAEAELARARKSGDEQAIKDAEQALADINEAIAKAKAQIPELTENLSDQERALRRDNERLFREMIESGRGVMGDANADVRAVGAAAGLSQADMLELQMAIVEGRNAQRRVDAVANAPLSFEQQKLAYEQALAKFFPPGGAVPPYETVVQAFGVFLDEVLRRRAGGQ